LKYLPSKKFILIFLSLSVVIAGAFILFGNEPKKGNLSFERTGEASRLVKSAAVKDSDNDGLKDWEESLWGTDPENPDTDGDGTNDGEEPSLGRNPLKKGPDDKLDDIPNDANLKSSKNSSTKTLESLPESDTLTDALSKELFLEYISLKNSGDFAEGDEEKLVSSLISKVSPEISFDRYTLQDILIVPNSKEAANEYLEGISGVIFKYMLGEDAKNEPGIIASVVQSGGKEGVVELDPIINLYTNATGELVSVKTPSGISEPHVRLINSTSGIAEALTEMKSMETDPVLGLFSLQKYTAYWQEINAATDDIMTYLQNVGAISPDAIEEYTKMLNN